MSSSATLIQSAWRRFSARLQFRFDLSDIVFIQSLVRKKIAMKSIWQRKEAIITIQRFIRKSFMQAESISTNGCVLAQKVSINPHLNSF